MTNAHHEGAGSCAGSAGNTYSIVDAPGRRQNLILEKKEICADIVEFKVHCPQAAAYCEPGQCVVVRGDEKAERTTLRGLRHAQGFFQETVSRELALKFCPKISFEIDHTVKRSARIAELLHEECTELGEAAGEHDEGDEADGEDHLGQDTA